MRAQARRQTSDLRKMIEGADVDIKGSAAIVTGGASGLGGATAAALAAAGATVYGFDLPSAIESAPEVEGVIYVPVDVTVPDDVRAGIQRATDGSHPLRALVNCAGVVSAAPLVGPDGAHDLEAFADVVRINLIGTFNTLALGAAAIAATAADEQGRRGVIVNTTSIAAFDGQQGQTAYSASKGGVVALTLPAARDLAEFGIRVMAIAPGMFLTPMLRVFASGLTDGRTDKVPFPQRLGDPSEYADLVLGIIANDYLNGEVIRLDAALRLASRRALPA